jgi:putative permease
VLEILKSWYHRNFSDPQAVTLVIFLVVLFAVVLLLGDILAPVLVAILFAYLLDGVVSVFEGWRVPRTLATSVVVLLFVLLCLFLFLGLVPLLSQQVTQLIFQIPQMAARFQEALLTLPELYPSLITEPQIQDIFTEIRLRITSLGQAIVSFSLTHAVNVFTIAIYVILIPILVFFSLKDKHRIVAWVMQFLPHERERELSFQVWVEVDQKIANYIRGKFIEIAIVWAVTYVTFALMGLNFSLLLSFLVGISVIIPFVGAIAVTLPVALIAYFQWGIAAQFWYLLLAYQIIQILDGNALVPILFSEVVNLHPVAIIVAVLFFGGLWGVWGVFFAIPLATLVQAVLNAWPRDDDFEETQPPE